MDDEFNIDDKDIDVIVIPFVACKSKGGHYDDEAFMAGSLAMYIMMALQDPETESPTCVPVPPQLIPQIDLIAMTYGWTIDVEESDDIEDGNVLAIFDKTEPVDDLDSSILCQFGEPE
jgi:hypothetical protein